jgi:hypothetical protein
MNPSEMAEVAASIADICRNAKGPVAVIIPMGGLSAFDAPDGPLLENPDGGRPWHKPWKRTCRSTFPVPSQDTTSIIRTSPGKSSIGLPAFLRAFPATRWGDLNIKLGMGS